MPYRKTNWGRDTPVSPLTDRFADALNNLETQYDHAVEYVDSKSGGLEVYDEFAHYTNGASLAAAQPLKGNAWQTTGANAVVISNGRATSVGAGYLWQALGAPVAGMACDIVWTAGGNPDTENMTLAIAAGTDTLQLENISVHLNFGPKGFFNQVREGGAWSGVLSGVWHTPMRMDGATVYRIGLRRRGDTLIVTGPSGETFAVTDERIGRLSGRVCFWEPGGSLLTRAGAYSTAQIPYTVDNLTGADAGVGFIVGNQGRVVGSRDTSKEVSIGEDPSTNMPGILFGPADSQPPRIFNQFGDLHVPGKMQWDNGANAAIYGNGPNGVGLYFSDGYDTGLIRDRAGVLKMRDQGLFRNGSGTTAQRPNATTAEGAVYVDKTLGFPVWSDGTVWRKFTDNSSVGA